MHYNSTFFVEFSTNIVEHSTIFVVFSCKYSRKKQLYLRQHLYRPSEDTGSTSSYLPVQCCDLHIESTSSFCITIVSACHVLGWVYCINIVSAHTMYRGKSEKVYCLQTKAVSLSACPSLKVWAVCIRWIAYRKKL